MRLYGLGRRAVVATLLLVAIATAGPASALATTVNISGQVNKNGAWTYYTTSRCTTSGGGGFIKLQVQAWAGDNADDYFYVRSTQTGLAIGSYTEANPLHMPLHDSTTRSFGTFVLGTCFVNTARKDGLIFASGFETWTALETY
jgi:hypothetical protein